MVYNSSENVYQTSTIIHQLLSSAIPSKQNPAVFLFMRARWTASTSLRETYFRCSQACAFFSPATPSKTTTSHVHPPPAFSRSLVLSFSGFMISRTVTQRSLQLPPYFQLIFSSHTRKPALRSGPRREILSPAGVWSPFNIFLPRILFSAARRTTSLEQRNPDRLSPLSPGRV